MTHCLSPRIFVEVEKRESFRLQLFCLALLEKAALIRLYSEQQFDHNRPGWVEEALNISWGRYLWASALRRMRMCMMALYSTISLYNLLLRVTEVFVLLVGGNVGEKMFVYSSKWMPACFRMFYWTTFFFFDHCFEFVIYSQLYGPVENVCLGNLVVESLCGLVVMTVKTEW